MTNKYKNISNFNNIDNMSGGYYLPNAKLEKDSFANLNTLLNKPTINEITDITQYNGNGDIFKSIKSTKPEEGISKLSLILFGNNVSTDNGNFKEIDSAFSDNDFRKHHIYILNKLIEWATNYNDTFGDVDHRSGVISNLIKLNDTIQELNKELNEGKKEGIGLKLKQEFDELKTKNNDPQLINKITQLENNFNQLQQKYQILEDKYQQQESKINSQESKINSQDSKINSQENILQEHDDRVSDQEELSDYNQMRQQYTNNQIMMQKYDQNRIIKNQENLKNKIRQQQNTLNNNINNINTNNINNKDTNYKNNNLNKIDKNNFNYNLIENEENKDIINDLSLFENIKNKNNIKLNLTKNDILNFK